MDDGNEIVICVVNEAVSIKALKIISSIDKDIHFRACGSSDNPRIEFFTNNPLTENHRAALENVIRGIVFVL